jgi:hypothetical protein
MILCSGCARRSRHWGKHSEVVGTNGGSQSICVPELILLLLDGEQLRLQRLKFRR